MVLLNLKLVVEYFRKNIHLDYAFKILSVRHKDNHFKKVKLASKSVFIEIYVLMNLKT